MTTFPPRRRPLAALLLLGALPALAGPAPAQVKRGLKVGLWQKRHRPEGWVLYQSRSYQIQSQAGLDKAKRLAKHMEGMVAVYKRLFPPGKSTHKRYAVKLFRGRREFLAYSGKGGAAGYYSPTEREMVLYDTGKWSDEQEAAATGNGAAASAEALRRRYNMDILGVAAHEGWHQYFHWYVTSWVYLPSWVNEGMGDYFYTATPKKAKGRRVPAELGRLNAIRLPVIRRAVERGQHVPIAKLLRYTQRDYYSNPSLCYAEGWSLCHFLLHGGGKRYAKLVPAFIKRFKDRGNWQKNTDLVFAKVDLARLEKDWKAWVLAQKPQRPSLDALRKLLEEGRKRKPGGKGRPPGGGAPLSSSRPSSAARRGPSRAGPARS